MFRHPLVIDPDPEPGTPWRCRLLGHRFDTPLEDAPENALYYRIDCTRKGCDFAVDAVALERAMESMPQSIQAVLHRRGL